MTYEEIIEAQNYFFGGDDDSLDHAVNYPTKYAIANHEWFRIYLRYGDVMEWWLRSPGRIQSFAAIITYVPDIANISDEYIDEEVITVRPVVLVQL